MKNGRSVGQNSLIDVARVSGEAIRDFSYDWHLDKLRPWGFVQNLQVRWWLTKRFLRRWMLLRR